MGQPVVHFEIIGSDRAKLRSYYGELFGWEFQIGDATTQTVSQPGNYGFVDGATAGGGINGGVGGGDSYEGRVLFYVGVPNVETALERAESLGGKRHMGPEGTPGTLVVGRFTDPEGNLTASLEQSGPPTPTARACRAPRIMPTERGLAGGSRST